MAAQTLSSPAGRLRVMCPHRFKQRRTVFSTVGQTILGTALPRVVGEVRFLRRDKEIAAVEDTTDESSGETEQDAEDVGNIDNVLVHPDTTTLRWCALEIQAVYFSGERMGLLFAHIRNYEGPASRFQIRLDALTR